MSALQHAEDMMSPAPAMIAWTAGTLDPEAVERAHLPGGLTLAEALGRTTLDLTNPVLVKMQVGGESLYYGRAEWAETVVPAGARIAAIDMPTGKKGSQIAMVLAIIVAAAIIGPEIGGFLGEALALGAEATKIVSTVATLAVQAGLSALLLPKPAAQAQQKQGSVSPTYSVTAQGNYARLGAAVPEHLGRHLHFPDFICAFKEYAGTDEFLHLGFSLGEGYFDIHEYGWASSPAYRYEPSNLLGRTDWTTLSDAVVVASDAPWGLSDWEIQLVSPSPATLMLAYGGPRAWPSGTPITWSFIAWVTGTNAAQTLHTEFNPVAGIAGVDFTVTTEPQFFQRTFTSSHGDLASASARLSAIGVPTGAVIHVKDLSIVGRDYAAPYEDRPANLQTGLTGAFPGIEVEIVTPGTSPTLFSDAVASAPEVSGQTLLAPNEDGHDYIGPIVLNDVGTECLGVGVDVGWGRGLYKQNADGSYASATVAIQVDVQAIDDAGLPVSDWIALIVDDETASTGPRLHRRTFKEATTAGRYQARMKRANDKQTDPAVIDETSWIGLKAYFAPSESSGSETWLMVRARANEQLQGSVASQFYVKKTRLLPQWNGSSWTGLRASRSPAWAIAHVYRSCWPDGAIDTDSLTALDATWRVRGDTFDGIFDNAQPAWDALKAIARVGRTRPLLPGGTLSLVRDEPKTIRQASLNPGNTLAGSASVDYILANTDLPDCLIVEYLDERTWKPATVRCVLPGVTPTTTKRVKVPFIVRRTQAWREGMFEVACNTWRRCLASCDTEHEGLLLWPLHKVLFGHDATNWGELGKVHQFDGRRVVMDRPLTWKTGETHMLSLTQTNGRVWGPVAVTRESDHVCVLPDPLPGGLADPSTVCKSRLSGGGRWEPSRAQFGYGTRVAKDMLVVGSVPRAGGKASVSLVIDDARVHTADAGMPPALAAPPTAPAAEDLVIDSLDITDDAQTHYNNVSFGVTGAPDHRGFQLRIDGGAIASFSAPGWVTGVYAGSHIFTVRAIGRFGYGPWFELEQIIGIPDPGP